MVDLELCVAYVCGHALGSESQRDSHSGQETFRDGGDNDTDGEENRLGDTGKILH